MDDDGLAQPLFAALLRAAYAYQQGVHHHRPYGLPPSVRRSPLARVGERARDLMDRPLARLGAGRARIDLDVAATRLGIIAEDLAGLERTWSLLADEASRDLFVRILCLRVWGPTHVPLPLTARDTRRDVARVEREMRVERETLGTTDWYSPTLDRYEVPRPGGTIGLHGSAVGIHHVFLAEQYAYRSSAVTLAAGPGDVVLDCGASWGDTALYFADLVGPEGRVHAFELSPESLRVAERNLALNPSLAERVELVAAALWDRPGVSIAFAEFGQSTSLTRPLTEGTSGHVSTTTLDEWAGRRGVERVDFVKLDVEGAELHVLRGAEATLRRHRPTLAVAAYHDDSDLVDIPAYLDSLAVGYELFLGHYTAVADETILFARVPGR